MPKLMMRISAILCMGIGVFATIHYLSLYAAGYTVHPVLAGGTIVLPATLIFIISGGILTWKLSYYAIPSTHVLTHSIQHRFHSPLLEQIEQSVQVSICTVCNEHPVTDKHYHLCSSCKHLYNAEMQRVRTQRHRAKEAGLDCTLTIVEWLHTLQAFKFKCAYCQVNRFEVMEHIIPMKHGGGTTKENCTPACTLCNSHKHAKYLD